MPFQYVLCCTGFGYSPKSTFQSGCFRSFVCPYICPYVETNKNCLRIPMINPILSGTECYYCKDNFYFRSIMRLKSLARSTTSRWCVRMEGAVCGNNARRARKVRKSSLPLRLVHRLCNTEFVECPLAQNTCIHCSNLHG